LYFLLTTTDPQPAAEKDPAAHDERLGQKKSLRIRAFGSWAKKSMPFVLPTGVGIRAGHRSDPLLR